MLTVFESTVVVVPATLKLPVITIVSPESAPITMFSFAAPPEDSKAANLVSKLAFETSTSTPCIEPTVIHLLLLDNTLSFSIGVPSTAERSAVTVTAPVVAELGVKST